MDLRQQFSTLQAFLREKVAGQEHLTERLVIALLCGGHVLTEGLPGLAKTRAAKAVACCVKASFRRIQFTPDILPGDLTGTDIYHQEKGCFQFYKGPLFNNIILADELNRAPAKVQSALLESMAEGQISIANHTFRLPEFFMVMATLNPSDNEGTYPLSEAQVDRFLFNLKVTFPSAVNEKKILRSNRKETMTTADFYPPLLISQGDILQARKALLSMHMATSVEDYIVRLIDATRHPVSGGSIAPMLVCGVGPRGTQALDLAARAHAWLYGRDFVSPEDVKSVAHDVLRHRIKPEFQAIANGQTPDTIISLLLKETIIT